jgi:hypothetical protein
MADVWWNFFLLGSVFVKIKKIIHRTMCNYVFIMTFTEIGNINQLIAIYGISDLNRENEGKKKISTPMSKQDRMDRARGTCWLWPQELAEIITTDGSKNMAEIITTDDSKNKHANVFSKQKPQTNFIIFYASIYTRVRIHTHTHNQHTQLSV